MAEPLPPLRRELDIMPSPAPEQPGLLMRDPFRYTDAMIVVPPLLARALVLFDNEHTELDLKAFLTRITGNVLRSAEIAEQFIRALEENGFLESPRFYEIRDRKRREFAEAEIRTPAHAGIAYPAETDALKEKLTEYGASPERNAGGGNSLAAIAAPHVSPEGGWRSYAAAYRKLNPDYADKTFVLLGTSHYGEPEKFGLTQKPYVTPFGTIETDRKLVDSLAKKAPEAVEMEDYCHSSEHSIEFQCIFLVHVLGTPNFKVVPILCGPFAESLLTGKAPETNEKVGSFLDAFGEMAEAHRDKLVWVLGIDMAHIGRRYGDQMPAEADRGLMLEVRERDMDRIERICSADAEGFFEKVHPEQDNLRWCGYSPVYTFLRAVPGVEGKLLQYEQWNIDQQSVVSFAGIEFTKK